MTRTELKKLIREEYIKTQMNEATYKSGKDAASGLEQMWDDYNELMYYFKEKARNASGDEKNEYADCLKIMTSSGLGKGLKYATDKLKRKFASKDNFEF